MQGVVKKLMMAKSKVYNIIAFQNLRTKNIRRHVVCDALKRKSYLSFVLGLVDCVGIL
jgi:hypothetical protein